MRLFQASRGGVYAGFETEAGEVVRTAPVLRRDIQGLRETTAIAVLERKGYRVIRVKAEAERAEGRLPPVSDRSETTL